MEQTTPPIQDPLRQRQELLRLMLGQVPCVLWSTDLDLRITMGVGAGLAALGQGDNQFMGVSLFDCFGTKDPDFPPLAAHRRALQGEGISCELQWLGRVFQAHVEPLRAQDGAVIGTSGVALDITERERATEALRASEARLRQLVETVRVIPWEADLATWRFTYVGPRAKELLGYPVEEWYGPGFWVEHLHAEDRAWATESCRRACEQGEEHEIEYRMLAADGRPVWLRDIASMEMGPAGPVGLRGFMFDVTERKAAEATLRTSEARFRAVFEEAGIGIAMIDLQDRPVEVNPALEQMLGYSADELRRMTFAELTHPADAALGADLRRELLGGERDSYRLEKRFRRKDGRLLWSHLSVSLLRDAGGRPSVMVAMMEDVTERMRAEERGAAFLSLGQKLNEVRTPEEAARVVVQVADDLLGWDACWLELAGTNGARPRMIVLVDTLQGERVDVPTPYPDLPVGPMTRRALEEGPILTLREPENMPNPRDPELLVFGDTARLSASILCVPIRTAERGIGALCIQSYSYDAYSQEDLKVLQALADYCAGALERRRAEAAREDLYGQLLQSQKMEAVGRLAGGVAHDFNNMLGVINGYSNLMLGRTDLDEPLRTALREINSAGERAAGLTRQLLAFSRKSLVAPRVLNLNEIVIEMGQMLGRLIGENIDLRTELEPALAPVRADRGQLEQVLLNLAVNARDAMPQGGQLAIHTRNLTVSGSQARDHVGPEAGEYVLLIVRDTGCGMDSELLAHIWEPFYTTKGNLGTGLGLATVYGIIKQAGGHIEVESAPGRGTTFRILLPRAVA